MGDGELDALGHADIGPRIAGAWGEIGARLQARQSVNLQLMMALMAAFAGTALQIREIASGGQVNGPGILLMALMSVAALTVTYAATLWVRHNDFIIGLLGSFCQACGSRIDPGNERGIPDWFSRDHGWLEAALEARKLSDRSLKFLSALAAVLPITCGAVLCPTHKILGSAFILVAVAAAWLIVRGIAAQAAMRKDLHDNRTFRNENGKWKLGDSAAPKPPPG